MFDEQSIREALRDIDNDETIEVTPEEAGFLESFIFHQDYPMTASQERWASDIIEKYS